MQSLYFCDFHAVSFSGPTDNFSCRELVGAPVDWESLEKQSEKELKQMDTHIVHEMDREIRSQQAKLAKVCVCMCVYVLYR